MKKSSLIEYAAYALARALGALIVSLPVRINSLMGEFLGIAGYYALKKKRRLVLKNIKIAYGGALPIEEVERIARKAFISLALTIVETLYIPRIDARYINKHVRIENLKHLDDALKRGKGVILLAYHMGNWELANITCSLQGYAYKVIVNEQRYPLLNNLLNRYRELKGCKTIPRGVALREIMRGLKNNEVVAMVGDQGGKEGHVSNFFGLPTSMPTGFVRFAFATEARIIPAIIVRERRFYHRIILEKPLKTEEGADEKERLEHCLNQSSAILERHIRLCPQEYFWFYKIWKYSPFRHVVLLSDNKAGHLRQSEAVLKIVKRLQPIVYSTVIDVKFKNSFAKILAKVCMGFGLDIYEFCLKSKTRRALSKVPADLVISCGASLAGLTFSVAQENQARSVCIMDPAQAVSRKKFDVVIIPRHDNPPKGKNIVRTLGALKLIDEAYLTEHAERLKAKIPGIGHKLSLGLLIGGDTKHYRLTIETAREVIAQLKKAAQALDADILVTTSRRTPANIENLLREELKEYPSCKLLVIANQMNIPEAVGGILGLSDFIVVSGESISMVSEAASSGKYVGVFRLKAASAFCGKTRHEAFLHNAARHGSLYLIDTPAIADTIKEVLQERPAVKKLDDSLCVQEAIRKLL